MAAFASKLRRAQRIAKPRTDLTEDEIHFEVVRLLRAVEPAIAFFHSPNEGHRAKVYQQTLWRRGVSAGVPDIIIITPPPCGGYVAAALEIKSEKGRPSKAQRAWLDTLAAAGWAVAWDQGLPACIRRLEEWGYL